MNKICCKCKEEKDLKEFSKNKTRRDGHSSCCRQCHSVYHKKWHEKNKTQRRTDIKDYKIASRNWLHKYKLTLTCSRCPENHPATLDFHHINGDEKEINLGSAGRMGWSITRIKKEIAKCIVLCANCHRKHHAADVGSTPTASAIL